MFRGIQMGMYHKSKLRKWKTLFLQHTKKVDDFCRVSFNVKEANVWHIYTYICCSRVHHDKQRYIISAAWTGWYEK